MRAPSDFLTGDIASALSSGSLAAAPGEGNPLVAAFKKLPFVEAVSGFIRKRHYIDTARDSNAEEVYELRNDFRLGTTLRFTEKITGTISGDAELDFGLNRDDFHSEEKTVRLWEAYAEFDLGDLSLRIGQEVIRWGKGDEVNPIDNFTPENFKEFINLDRADRKMPVTAVDMTYYFSDKTSVQGLWLPFFRENRFAESGQDWEFFFHKNYRDLGFQFLPERRSDHGLADSTAATRLVHQGSLGDVSISYAYHFDQNPAFHAQINQNSARPTIDTTWQREHSVGADFEIAHEGWGYRGEAVYTTNKPYITFDPSDSDLVEEKNTFSTLLGIDHTFTNQIYANLQLLQDFILNHDRGMQARAWESSFTWRFWKKFLHEKLKLQTTGRFFVTDKDFFYKFDATYEIREGLEVTAGIGVFEGESQGLFGQFDDNDQVYIKTTFHF